METRKAVYFFFLNFCIYILFEWTAIFALKSRLGYFLYAIAGRRADDKLIGWETGKTNGQKQTFPNTQSLLSHTHSSGAVHVLDALLNPIRTMFVKGVLLRKKFIILERVDRQAAKEGGVRRRNPKSSANRGCFFFLPQEQTKATTCIMHRM